MKIFFFLILMWIFFPFHVVSDETFLSLKKSKVNVRYGPSFESPIKFVYKKVNLPIKQIDKKENWRRIIDLKNNSGWIHWSQLKTNNSIIPLEDKILFKKPSNFSRPIAKIKKGRLIIVKRCEKNWCKIETGKFSGWIKTNNIWGSIN
tara:strand:- start:375 stop:818 length:444 start_codon:yes stop_codon:yes gene_type:complete